MANNNNSKKNRKKQQPHFESDPYDPQLAKVGRKEKRRSKRHNDKHILRQFPEYADDYFEQHEDMG